MTEERLFTVEEAARLLSQVETDLDKAVEELDELRDQIILARRILMQKERTGKQPTPEEQAAFEAKRQAHDWVTNRWIQHFTDQGILIRDIERGLVDFPYRASSGQKFFLCWQRGEEGLFYFHDTHEGFSGRKPITLLPD